MKMKIKINGVREPENMRAIVELGVDFMGLIFDSASPRNVNSVSSHAGIIPDRPNDAVSAISCMPKMVGVFTDEMPQTVVTQAYNYKLDWLQLCGEESPVYIQNLRSTLDPDIRPGVRIIKVVVVDEPSDVEKAMLYDGSADMIIFSFSARGRENAGFAAVNAYRGALPFMIGGNVCPADAELLRTIENPLFVGFDLDEAFESAPAVKDVEVIRLFMDSVKR